jgi:hypothetical protein
MIIKCKYYDLNLLFEKKLSTTNVSDYYESIFFCTGFTGRIDYR